MTDGTTSGPVTSDPALINSFIEASERIHAKLLHRPSPTYFIPLRDAPGMTATPKSGLTLTVLVEHYISAEQERDQLAAVATHLTALTDALGLPKPTLTHRITEDGTEYTFTSTGE